MEGMISNHLVSILIDPGSNLSYVSPQTVEKCKLQQVKHAKSWLVQLATRTKRKVTEVKDKIWELLICGGAIWAYQCTNHFYMLNE
jgi:hypothetical protein